MLHLTIHNTYPKLKEKYSVAIVVFTKTVHNAVVAVIGAKMGLKMLK